MSSLPEGESIYYISPETTKLFHPNEGQNVVRAIKSHMGFCFVVSNNVVPVEYILEMHNIGNTLSEAEIYNARICCHYID